jgi:uncharacterized protein YciI
VSLSILPAADRLTGMHALVLMAPGPAYESAPALQEQHVAFIDGLDKEGTIVLGGGWSQPAGGFVSAYLLSCGTLEQAREIAASDPLVRGDAIRCEVVEWELVGVNPDAVDRDALLYPDWHSGG